MFDDPCDGKPRRQVRPRIGPRLPQRRPSPGAPADDAAPARRGGGAQDRRLHLGLPRLAARRLRHQPVAGPALPREQRHRLRARHQRGPGRHRGVGQPAAQRPAGGQVRRRVRDLVRQGAGPRPLGRSPQARQLRRRLAARRRAGDGGRRPRRQVVEPGPSERPRLHPLRHADLQPGHGPGLPRPRPLWLGPVALLGLLDRLQVRHRDRRQLGLGVGRPAPRRDRHARGLRDARGGRAHALARLPPGPGGTPLSLSAPGGPSLRAREPPRPHGDRRAQAPARHRHLGQGLPRRAPGPRRAWPRRGACRRPRALDLQGGHALAAGARGRAPLLRRPRRGPGGRGEAPGDRGPARQAALQPGARRTAAPHRQARR